MVHVQPNLEATVSHFTKRKFYGLGQNNLKFFAQEMCLRPISTVIFCTETPSRSLPMVGGSLKALIDSDSIADMETRESNRLIFQVDNPLVSPINPFSWGCRLEEIGYVRSSITKTGPFEKLGNFVSIGDRLAIVEYSDLPNDKAQEKDAQVASNTVPAARRFTSYAGISSSNSQAEKSSCLTTGRKRKSLI